MKIQIFGSGGLEYLPYAKKKVKQLTEGKKLFETKQKIHIPEHGVRITVKSDENETVKIETYLPLYFQGDFYNENDYVVGQETFYGSDVVTSTYITTVTNIEIELTLNNGSTVMLNGKEVIETIDEYSSTFYFNPSPNDSIFITGQLMASYPLAGYSALVNKNIISTRTIGSRVYFRNEVFAHNIFVDGDVSPPGGIYIHPEWGPLSKVGGDIWVAKSPSGWARTSRILPQKITRTNGGFDGFESYLDSIMPSADEINKSSIHFLISNVNIGNVSESIDRTRYADGTPSSFNLPRNLSFGYVESIAPTDGYFVDKYAFIFYDRLDGLVKRAVFDINAPISGYLNNSTHITVSTEFVYSGLNTIQPDPLINYSLVGVANVDIERWFKIDLETRLYALERNLQNSIDNGLSEEVILFQQKQIDEFKSKKYILACGNSVFSETTSTLHSTLHAKFNDNINDFVITNSEVVEYDFDLSLLDSEQFKLNLNRFYFLIYSKGYARQNILASDTEPQIESKKKLQKDLMLLNKNL